MTSNFSIRTAGLREWIRDHLVASLLLVAGLGAVGQYAIGSLTSAAAGRRATIGHNSRQGTLAVKRAGNAVIDGELVELDAGINDIEDALAKGVDPGLEPSLRGIADDFRRWHAKLASPRTRAEPPDFMPRLEEIKRQQARLRQVYGEYYR